MDTLPALAFSRLLVRLLIRTFAACWLALAALPGHAQDAPIDTPGAVDAGLEQQIRQLAQGASHAGSAGAPRIEVSIGQLDPRLRLAPCARVEPYLPEGMRLWGKARIGLRCAVGPTRWNVYLPITVKAFGPGLVAAGAAASGSVLTEADLTSAEVDLAESASVAITEARLAIGRTLTQALKPGQSLRLSHLRPRQWFAAGETVTVLAQGAGFSVSGEGQALNNGVEGQPVRVRTESGRVLTGQAVGERRVELGL
jgi:flagellar basal body P-ring formation protein FlgA